MGMREQYCRLSNKRPNAKYGLPLLDLLVSGVSETPKHYRFFSVFLSYPPEPEGKALLLKTLHT